MFQISDNSWLPFDLRVPSSLYYLKALNSNVISVLGNPSPNINLEILTLDDNVLQHRSTDNQWFGVLTGVSTFAHLQVFSCARCHLTTPLVLLSKVFGIFIQVLQLSQNNLTGVLPSFWFSTFVHQDEIQFTASALNNSRSRTDYHDALYVMSQVGSSHWRAAWRIHTVANFFDVVGLQL
jgi:hypothetical protein